MLASVVIRKATTQVIAHRVNEGGVAHDRNGEAWFINTIAPDVSVFVDVGANVGNWTALMLGAAPAARGVLFEPGSEALVRLTSRYASDDRITIVSAAAADRPGTADFFEEDGAGESSSFIAGNNGREMSRTNVDLVTLDDELERLGVDHVDLLKIDAEGFDLHVLRGARRMLAAGRIGAVQFEYNTSWREAGGTLAAADALMAASDLKLYALRNGELRTFNLWRLGELFAMANYVALGPAARQRFASAIGGDVLA